MSQSGPTPAHIVQPPITVPQILLAWLIPGYAFWCLGLRRRAGFLFTVLQGTFLIGCLLRGSVVLPDLQSGADGFNIVAILVFIVQMGNGGLAMISALPEFLGPHAAILPTNEAHAYADLGQMYLLVSGGMNYFLVMSAVGGSSESVQSLSPPIQKGEA